MPKPIKRRADERRIAKDREWELVELKTLSSPPWVTVKVYWHVPAKRGQGKRTFQFGWNVKEKRWSLCPPVDALAKNHPRALVWARSFMEDRHA